MDAEDNAVPRPTTIEDAMREADAWRESPLAAEPAPFADVLEARGAYLRMRGWSRRVNALFEDVWLPPLWAALMGAPEVASTRVAWAWAVETDAALYDATLYGGGDC